MWEPKDIRIDTYQAAVVGAEYNVKLTHLPSGTYTTIHTSRSLTKAKKQAEAELASLLYSTADARCNFCNGPMPCRCEPPLDIDEQIDEQLDAWSKYSDLLDDR